MPLFELVQANAAIGEVAADSFSARFTQLEAELLERLRALIRRFPTSGGRFVVDDTTSVVLNEVNRILEKVMQKEQLREAVRDLMPDFDRVATNVAIMHGEESGIRVSQSLMNDAKMRMVQMTTQTAVDVSFEARFVQPVRRVLYNHVNFGAGIVETERAIRDLVGTRQLSDTTLAGSPRTKPGLMSQYAGQVARDAIHQYEGQVHRQIANLHDLKNWRYIGNILPGHTSSTGKRSGGTRPQCRRWVRKGIIMGVDLPEELAWAANNGSGFIPGTTTTTFAIYRGGYNCRHKAIPTRRTDAK